MTHCIEFLFRFNQFVNCSRKYLVWYFFFAWLIWQRYRSRMFAEIARSSYIAFSRVLGRRLFQPTCAASAKQLCSSYRFIQAQSLRKKSEKMPMFETIAKGNINSPDYALYFSKYAKLNKTKYALLCKSVIRWNKRIQYTKSIKLN